MKYSWVKNWWKYWTILLVYNPQNQRCRKATYCKIWPIWIFEQMTKYFNPSLLISKKEEESHIEQVRYKPESTWPLLRQPWAQPYQFSEILMWCVTICFCYLSFRQMSRKGLFLFHNYCLLYSCQEVTVKEKFVPTHMCLLHVRTHTHTHTHMHASSLAQSPTQTFANKILLHHLYFFHSWHQQIKTCCFISL